MSFRETRNFIEKMRALGYPRPLSWESFRQPNFELVADMAHWLIKCFDPSDELVLDIATEHDRVMFVKNVAILMATKAHIHLNTKRLYGADGYAVKELLKIANMLFEASRTKHQELEDEISTSAIHNDALNYQTHLKMCRALAADIGNKGAELYERLVKEPELRDARLAAIAKQLDEHSIQSSIQYWTRTTQDQIQATMHTLENLSADETNLKAKIEKKKVDLDRREKRLKSLQAVRPAYMDEFERLEAEVQSLYGVYMTKFRNLSYLEQQYEELQRRESEQADETFESLKQMQSRLRDEELHMLRGEKELDSNSQTDLIGSSPSLSSNSGNQTPDNQNVKHDLENSGRGSSLRERVMGDITGGSDDEEMDDSDFQTGVTGGFGTNFGGNSRTSKVANGAFFDEEYQSESDSANNFLKTDGYGRHQEGSEEEEEETVSDAHDF